MRRSLLTAVMTAILVVVIGASVAFAGEITGNGKSLKNEDGTLNGRSECAFSGLDDADEDGFEKTQNWGQLDKETRAFLASIGFHPSVACNPAATG